MNNNETKKPYKTWNLYAIIHNEEKATNHWQWLGKGFDNKDSSINIVQNLFTTENKLQLRIDKKTEEKNIEMNPDEFPSQWDIFAAIPGKGNKTIWILIGRGFTNEDYSINLLLNAQAKLGKIQLKPHTETDKMLTEKEQIYGTELPDDEIPI